MTSKIDPQGIEADAPQASASDAPKKFGTGAGRKRLKQPKREYKMQLPPDVEEYIRENGGSGFVVGLVRSVMR